jgi:GNAT superfamily N-acetyltransferase
MEPPVADAGEIQVRSAGPDDVPALPGIERRAGALFRAVAMDAVADDELPTPAHLSRYQLAGRAWVAVDPSGSGPVGYLLADRVDGTAHIEQVSVDPAYGRRGIGRRLIGAMAEWAAADGLDTATLTTFADVPWNAPYYARLGFTTLPDEDLPAGLRHIRQAEKDHGLDAWPRVSMTCPVHRLTVHCSG